MKRVDKSNSVKAKQVKSSKTASKMPPTVVSKAVSVKAAKEVATTSAGESAKKPSAATTKKNNAAMALEYKSCLARQARVVQEIELQEAFVAVKQTLMAYTKVFHEHDEMRDDSDGEETVVAPVAKKARTSKKDKVVEVEVAAEGGANDGAEDDDDVSGEDEGVEGDDAVEGEGDGEGDGEGEGDEDEDDE